MSLRPKRWIAGLRTCPHGGINYAELNALGVNPDDILDFSVSTNPFMPPPGIKETLGDIPVERYPDSQATELRERLSEKLTVPPEKILVGSGTTELIRLIAMTYFRKGEPVVVLEPTYGEYETACRIAGAGVIKYRAREDETFSPDITEIVALINERRPGAIFICNPNNPTGKYLSRRDVDRIMDSAGDGLLILDEAYVAFVENSWNSTDLATRDNVVILRSMTKDYGLPGLRLGYAVAHQDIIDSLRKVAPPWNVNTIAQKVAVGVLEQDEYLRQSLRQVRDAKRFLTDGLTRLGFTVLPSDANYFMVKVGSAREFRSSLLKHGVLVRDCTSFGLPEYVRIAPRTMPECEKFITTVDGMLR